MKLVLDQLLSEKRPLSREKLILSCPCLIYAPPPPPPSKITTKYWEIEKGENRSIYSVSCFNEGLGIASCSISALMSLGKANDNNTMTLNDDSEIGFEI